tara:strand:- start:80 stop:733 length:654 start_codon:yes stop_codon:yes gene_type:complete
MYGSKINDNIQVMKIQLSWLSRSLLTVLCLYVSSSLSFPLYATSVSGEIDRPFTQNGQFKLGLGYPELWTIEIEKSTSRDTSLYASYHGIKYEKNQESINLYGYTVGWRQYLTQHYGQYEGWFWGIGLMNRTLHVTQDNISISGLPGTFSLDAMGRLWMPYAEIGNTFIAPPFSYGLTVGLGYGSPSLTFSQGDASLLDLEIPSFWPIIRVWAGIMF